MKHENHIADFAGKTTGFAGVASKKKKAKKAKKSRAERKAEKNALLPIHKRPIVCPPDRAGRHPLFRLGGLICRIIVIWMAASGFVIFLSSALELGVSNAFIFLTALAVVAMVMLFCHSGVGKIVSGVLAMGSLGSTLALRPSLLSDIPLSFLALYNAALTRLHKVGYLAYERFKVDLTQWTYTDEHELVVVGVCLLTILFSLLFAACFVRRVRLVAPAILTSSILVVTLTFNIYSDRIRSNLGIALIMVSFASVLVMAAYDRLYHDKDEKHYDTELKLFEDPERPVLPAEYANDKAARAARKLAKAELRAKRRAHVVTVEEELDDYFHTEKKSKKKEQDKAARKAAKAADRELKRKVREAKNYDRITVEARTAMGGYAAIAVFLACLIAIAVPALFIKDKFSTINAIDEKMELARSYVTALLRGDDNALDRLEYQADRNNFKPHSTELEQLTFTGKQMFYIRSRYSTNYYLRGWVGTDYENGSWLAVSDETLKQYHELFGQDASPSEEMRYNFYHFMMPGLVDNPEYTEHYLTKYQASLDYGFVSTLVSLRRVNSPSTLTYFPASFAPQYGLYNFPKEGDLTLTESKLTFVDYYDGIFTGRKFNENGLSYSTVAYAPVMKNDYWIENQADLQATFNLQKEVLLASSALGGNLTLEIFSESDDLFMFKYTAKQGKEQKTWRFYHKAYSGNNGQIVVTGPHGFMIIQMNGRRVTDINYIPDQELSQQSGVQNMVDAYKNTMTDAERDELMAYLTLSQNYNRFAYDTYLSTTESEQLDALIQKMMDGADVHAALSAVRDTSSPEAYIERDKLVRYIVDYIISELGCTYSIEPDLTHVSPDMDGVENFLFNTKEGYCVQFASSVTLILRELGIPARYVEGYVASDLSKISRDEFIYGAYVRDYQAHAWVEVYFDGIGWIQYETTPQYYAGLYGSEVIGSTPVQPVLPPESETNATKPDEPVTEPESENESDTDDESEETTNADIQIAENVTRAGLIGLAVLAGMALVAFVIHSIISNARAAEARRQDIAEQVLDSGFGPNTSEEDRRQMALDMSDAVTNLLGYFELSPQPGEFRGEYAERLYTELRAEPKTSTKRKADTESAALPDLHMALDGMAAEEFGHGMSIAEMKQVAALYLCLHREIPKRLSAGMRFQLRYVKRKI